MTTQNSGKSQEGHKRVTGFQVVENECIWMKAGVVNFRLCDNAYDCNTCPFDKGLRRAMGLGKEFDTRKQAPEWVEHLRRNFQGASRPCRHALTGRIDAPKICTMNYECYHCPFDQMLDEIDVTEDRTAPSYQKASGYRMAEGYYYHLGHAWARFEHGGRVRIGLDDFLVRLFGAPGEVDLPPLGEAVAQSEPGWTFARGEHRAAVLSPVSGRVLAVNHRAREHPVITLEDPYHHGWLFIVEPQMPKRNLKGLYFGDQGRHWMEQESRRLLGLMGPEYEQLAATGGEPIRDVFGSFPQLGWEKLVTEFLRTRQR
jgi:glycine cleavage system H lipoate-binding protein